MNTTAAIIDNTNTSDTKKCTTCKNYLPLSEFGKCKTYHNGLNIRCRQCVREAQQQYLQKRITAAKLDGKLEAIQELLRAKSETNT